MALVDRIRIARRFQRSIRIDTDLTSASALEGFVCPQSSAEVLLTMARHAGEAGQGAFTWTGPYGSGKSSLVVAFCALLNGKAELRKQAAKMFSRELTTAVCDALPTGTHGWRIVPVVGRRENPIRVVGDAIEAAGLVSRKPRGGWSEKHLIDTLADAASNSPKIHGGVVLFIDEMGKFLEGAANDGGDVYIFQQLAEIANRSNRRLLIIGILHQAFEDYAHRLSHQMRDEWAKIQGRFVDLSVNTAGEEQIDLISRAIESDHCPKVPSAQAQLVATLLRRDRRAEAERLALTLESCWPLHPVVAGLLGPISRRRFGQNQRSIFGFLNSSEPHGFQDFLRRAGDDEIYSPDRLWDYLRANLEPSILASPDGHRWALAAEALERCEAIGGDSLHLKLLKTIAVIDLFKERSGLIPTVTLLRSCIPESSEALLKKALSKLAEWSFIIFKKFLDGYAIFAGSDFDIEQAIRAALDDSDELDFKVLKALAGLQPVLAKRHYHDTGALRWFDVDLAPVRDLLEVVGSYQPTSGAIGQFLLTIPTEGERDSDVSELCREAARHSSDWDIVVGMSKHSSGIVTLARELIALEAVRRDRPELAGDSVARRELAARLASIQSQIETELRRAFDGAVWYRKWQREPKPYRQADLNSLASDLAQKRFIACPRLHNELLNRQKPSSNAVAAQNELLRRMVLNEGQARLGIEGFPAEGGLFASLLEATGLYADGGQGWRFVSPGQVVEDHSRLGPMWQEATDHVKAHTERTVTVAEIYDLWRQQPYGVKAGLMPVLAVAFIMSQRNHVAVYREGIFRARFDDVDVQYLAKDPTIIQLRWMDLSDIARRLLSAMADVVRHLDHGNTLIHLEPIDVARGLVAVYEQLPSWTKRTMRLSANAVRVRELFRRARDPNQFLFIDIPSTLGDGPVLVDETLERVVVGVREGLEELAQAYPSMLHRLKDIMLSELQVPNPSPQSLAELRDRAENIRQLAGDFHLDAFVGRLSHFDGADAAFEGIASLAANKPPRDWVDPDLDRAAVDIAELSQKFLRAETFARVKGRPEKRHSMAIVIGLQGCPTPMIEEFSISDIDRAAVNDVVEQIAATLEGSHAGRRSLILAALAELSARYMRHPVKLGVKEEGRPVS